MRSVWLPWLLSAGVLVGAAIGLGHKVLHRGITGILIDSRGRYSLTHFQVVLWTIVGLSLIAGLFVARWLAGINGALSFTIPEQLLAAMGISLGGASAATAIKAGKDNAHPMRVAASDTGDPPRFSQVFLVEEGDAADQAVDVTKFQNFWITLILVAAFVALTFSFNEGRQVTEVEIPSFSGTLLTLLGISHAGYLAGKLPDKAGVPRGLSLELRQRGALPVGASGTPALTYTPRNSPPPPTP